MDTSVVWRGQTMDDRASDRRELLISAGFDLLGTEGAAATTMRAICRVAGLSQKYFYETFANREEVLVAVHNRVIEGLSSAVTATPTQGDLEARLRTVFDAATMYFEDDPRRVRVAFRETLADDTLRENAAVVVPAFVLNTAAHLSISPDELALDDPALALTVSSLSGAFVMVYLNWLEGRVQATRAQIAEHCTNLVLRSALIRNN